MTAHWIPTAEALTIMDPNQPKPLVKFPNYIRQDALQHHTRV